MDVVIPVSVTLKYAYNRKLVKRPMIALYRNQHSNNGYRITVNILQEETCRQFSLLIWTIIGQFVDAVGGGGLGKGGGWEETLF